MPTHTILVKPVLFCAPVFWGREFWAESAHSLDWVKAETPLADKPSVQVEVPVDGTMGEVFAIACDEWGLRAGPDLVKRGGTRESNFVRFAFVRPEVDAVGLSPQDGHRWPSSLPIARQDGTVEKVPGLQITFRELLASSSLGLLEGDVTRPYVHPVIPQGDPGTLIVVGKLTAHAIHAAYGALDARFGVVEHTIRPVISSVPTVEHTANKVLDEAGRLALIYGGYKWVRERAKNWRKARKAD